MLGCPSKVCEVSSQSLALALPATGRCAQCHMLYSAPAQALLASSHLYHEVKKNAESHGVIVDGVRMDLGKMMAQKETAVAGLTKGVEGLFKKYKARVAKT